MNIRFYIDPETGEPHIHGHDVSEWEVEECCRYRAKIARGEMDRAWPLARLLGVATCG